MNVCVSTVHENACLKFGATEWGRVCMLFLLFNRMVFGTYQMRSSIFRVVILRLGFMDPCSWAGARCRTN